MQQHDQLCFKNVFSKSNSKKASKSFWNAIKLFFTNIGIITNDRITLEENGILKSNPKETTEVSNNCDINIVETTSGKRTSSIRNPNSQCQDKPAVTKIIESYKNYPSFDSPPCIRKI